MDISVNAPSRPINIIAVSRSLPAAPSSGVMPVESPTVPNAEVTSNRFCIKEYSGSRTHIKKVPVQTTIRDRNITVNALEMVSAGSFL